MGKNSQGIHASYSEDISSGRVVMKVMVGLLLEVEDEGATGEEMTGQASVVIGGRVAAAREEGTDLVMTEGVKNGKETRTGKSEWCYW